MHRPLILSFIIFQALFYMFIFRHKQLLELEEGTLYDTLFGQLPLLDIPLACDIR